METEQFEQELPQEAQNLSHNRTWTSKASLSKYALV
jgi:hypothetical protein